MVKNPVTVIQVSALDRVNVARLTVDQENVLQLFVRSYLEPNASTRANAKQVFDGFLANILQQRGIYDFAVVCDTTNNTPARIDANEFYIDVAIEQLNVQSSVLHSN